MRSKAEKYLLRLCEEIPDRRVGSQGNQAATDFFADRAASFGFQVDTPQFDCMDWTEDGARLVVGDEPYQVSASPYTLGCGIYAPLVVVSTLEELEAVEIEDKILLMRGEIAKEPLMPKNFPFYNPDEHRRIISLMERKRPLGIVAATSQNQEMSGGLYPFPLIEDGDFDIPSVYTTEEEGNRLAKLAGKEASLDIQAQRIPSKGCNVIARKGTGSERRIVLTAHIDAKRGTPGALDNAAGIIVLLLLAELLDGDQGRSGIEIVAINGEDYYSNPGEVHYLESNQSKLDEIILGINLDGLGYHRGNTAYSLYGCPDEIAGLVRMIFLTEKGFVEGEQWYQGDHMLFALNGVPALAITSERMTEVTGITHTAKDRPELIDPSKLVGAAFALKKLIEKIRSDILESKL